MYVYQLTHDYGGSIKTIGYFGNWKKAREMMKKYRSSIEGFKDYPNDFVIRMSDGKLMETQTANYFSDIYPIDCAVLSANA